MVEFWLVQNSPGKSWGHEGIGKFSMAINGPDGRPLISYGYAPVQIVYQRPDAPIKKAGEKRKRQRSCSSNYGSEPIVDGRVLQAPRTVVNFSALCNVQGLVRDLIKCGGMKGILVEQPFDVFEENGQFRCAPPLVRVEKMFDHVQSKLPGAPKFLLCLLPERKISDLYGPRKKTCLTDFGIVTQCIAPTRVDDHLANVLLKINAKVLLLINFASKALSQSDGRWRYSSDNPESSTYAAGLALEALAGVISLASSEIDQSRVNTVKSDILKLFDSIQKYSTDDGTFYFDEKFASGREHQGSLSTTSSVVRGVTSFAAVTSGKIDLPGDKVLGLAKKNLGIGVPGSAKDFNQVESFTLLESKRVPIPLVLSLPATVYSLSKKDQLKELQYDQSSGLHVLSVFPDNVDVGTYVFVFEMALRDSGSENDYAIGGQIHVPIYVTGIVKVSNAEIAVLDSDLGSDETQKMLDLTGTDVVSLSANHLQKLRFSFQLTTPHGLTFKPRQVLLKLRHKTKYEHIFVVRNTGKKFEIILDFLGLVDKFYYLSGRYDFELTVGDAVMENSFLRPLGHLELDLPEAPEKAARLPPQPVDPYSRYGPKAEIAHLFRAPEKRPP